MLYLVLLRSQDTHLKITAGNSTGMLNILLHLIKTNSAPSKTAYKWLASRYPIFATNKGGDEKDLFTLNVLQGQKLNYKYRRSFDKEGDQDMQGRL